MSQKNSEFWNRARQARNKLADRFLDHPEVSLIDIGFDPAVQGERREEVVLRIHVREKWLKSKPEARAAFPKQMDGIPIVVVPGDFRLETDAPTRGD